MTFSVVYVRVPGMLAAAAAAAADKAVPSSPLAIAEGRLIRDANAFAVSRGVLPGLSVIHARRLCPTLLVRDLSEIPQSTLSRHSARLLDVLADLSPVVEPAGADAAFADLSAAGGGSISEDDLAARLAYSVPTGLPPLIGLGVSRLAARACAECGLSAERLEDADVRWLWPEDGAIVGKLQRLGLTTFGQVAALTESALVYQFGAKVGRLLYRRAKEGKDFTPVRALYPPLRADASLSLLQEPITDRQQLEEGLKRVCSQAARQLYGLHRHGRRVRLMIETEYRNDGAREWDGEWQDETVVVPVQTEAAILIAARNLLLRAEGAGQLAAPVMSLRLLVEDLDLPASSMADLFDNRQVGKKAALVALKRLLTTRYGPTGLRTLRELPLSLRDRRRAEMQERLRSCNLSCKNERLQERLLDRMPHQEAQTP